MEQRWKWLLAGENRRNLERYLLDHYFVHRTAWQFVVGSVLIFWKLHGLNENTLIYRRALHRQYFRHKTRNRHF
jgi:hypothetical protein